MTFQRITLVIGILVGLYTMSFNAVADLFPQSQVEASAEDQHSDEVVIKSFDAINYSTQINVDHESVLIEEIKESDEESPITHIKDQVVTNTFKAFKILFQRIISPNAP